MEMQYFELMVNATLGGQMEATLGQRICRGEISAILEAFNRRAWAKWQEDPAAAAKAEGILLGQSYAREGEPGPAIIEELTRLRDYIIADDGIWGGARSMAMETLLEIDETLSRYADPAGWSTDDPVSSYWVSRPIYQAYYVTGFCLGALGVDR